ncbi:lipocalin family protein [uncultured Flavobacterium sp.]|uniref:lipocalin family protein n=1 Tax=uncultured Flavobacterium sp. TaxID=165435 RepID=UPI0030C83F74
MKKVLTILICMLFINCSSDDSKINSEKLVGKWVNSAYFIDNVEYNNLDCQKKELEFYSNNNTFQTNYYADANLDCKANRIKTVNWSKIDENMYSFEYITYYTIEDPYYHSAYFENASIQNNTLTVNLVRIINSGNDLIKIKYVFKRK